jgi:ribosome-binding factor A
MPIQINGKLIKVLEVVNNISKEELLKEIRLKFPDSFSFEPTKVIFVQNKIINLIKEVSKN